MPEQDDGMGWLDKIKFFVSMWVVIFVAYNVWDVFHRHYGRWSPLSIFSVENAVITAVISLVITIFVMVSKIEDL